MAQAECKKCFINASLTPARGINCKLTTEKRITGVIGKTMVNLPTYSGPYNVIPEFYEQTLYTNNKLMTSDVEVEAIYVSSTPNPAGGNTIYIGGNIDHA